MTLSPLALAQLVLSLTTLLVAIIAFSPLKSNALLHINNTGLVAANMFPQRYSNVSLNVGLSSTSIYQKYDMGIWGFCGHYSGQEVMENTPDPFCERVTKYNFNMEEFYGTGYSDPKIEHGFHNYIYVATPPGLPSEDTLKQKSGLVYGFLIATVVVLILQLFLSVVIVLLPKIISIWSSLFSSLLTLLGVAFSAVVAGEMKFSEDVAEAYNDDSMNLGVHMTKGTQFQGLVYATVALTALSLLLSVAIGFFSKKAVHEVPQPEPESYEMSAHSSESKD